MKEYIRILAGNGVQFNCNEVQITWPAIKGDSNGLGFNNYYAGIEIRYTGGGSGTIMLDKIEFIKDYVPISFFPLNDIIRIPDISGLVGHFTGKSGIISNSTQNVWKNLLTESNLDMRGAAYPGFSIGTQTSDSYGFRAGTQYVTGGFNVRLETDPGLFDGSSYTFFHVTKYVVNGNKNRIWSSSVKNWKSGFHDTSRGSFYQEGILTAGWPLPDYNQNNSLDWMIVCDQPLYKGGTIRFYPEIQTEKENPVTYSGGGGNLDTMNKIGINTNEPSPFQCAEAIIFNRILTQEECKQVEEYLIAKYCVNNT